MIKKQFLCLKLEKTDSLINGLSDRGTCSPLVVSAMESLFYHRILAQVFLAISDSISNTKREAEAASPSSITAYRQDAYCW